jgi:hypothetical protein
MELRTTSAMAPSPVCSVIASKLRERIYAPHGLFTVIRAIFTPAYPVSNPTGNDGQGGRETPTPLQSGVHAIY